MTTNQLVCTIPPVSGKSEPQKSKTKKAESDRRKTLYMAASGGGTEGDGQTSPSSSVQPALAGQGRHGGHHHHHHTNRHRRHKHGSSSNNNNNNEPLYDRKLSPFDETSELAISTTGRQGAGLPPPTKPKPLNPGQQHFQEDRRAHGKNFEWPIVF